MAKTCHWKPNSLIIVVGILAPLIVVLIVLIVVGLVVVIIPLAIVTVGIIVLAVALLLRVARHVVQRVFQSVRGGKKSVSRSAMQKREDCSQNASMQARMTLKQLGKERVCAVAPTFYSWTITGKRELSSDCQRAKSQLTALESIAATGDCVRDRGRVRSSFVVEGLSERERRLLGLAN